MKQLKDKLLFVCLEEKVGEDASRLLADTLNMYFANCKELVEYDLFNSGAVLSLCGEDYYLMREKKAIKVTCSYENSVIFSNYDIFVHNIETFNKYTTKIYLRLNKNMLSKGNMLNRMNYEMRDKDLIDNVDFTIDLKSTNDKKIVKEIYNVLGGIK